MISNYYFDDVIKNGILKEKINKHLSGNMYITKSDPINKNQTLLCFKNKPNLVIIDDSVFTIKHYFSELYNKNFKTILIGGLGLGVLPFICEKFCEKITVIENELELINWSKNNILIDSHTQLINDNIFNYRSIDKYDVVCIDIWNFDTLNTIDNEIQQLRNIFKENINDGGIIYFPIKNLVFKY